MKICFIGVDISDALEGNVTGGAQKQQALMIRGLKDKGVDVLVLEYYLKDPKMINGIHFYPAWNNNRKYFFNKYKDIFDQIKSNDIGAVYVRGTQLYAAFLYLLLKIFNSKIKLLWGIAGDHDLTSKYNNLRVKYASTLYGKIHSGVLFNLSSKLLFHFSDKIICQTKEQIAMCRVKSKKKPLVKISNIYESNIKAKISNKIEADAIWVGKFSGNKGEDVLLRIVKDIPDIKIICLGHVTEKFKKTKTFQQIKNQKNLFLIGRVPYNEIDFYISKVNFILNTSPSEGFSNVFLEGWNQEKPVISLKVNPNQYLTKGEAGFCADSSYMKLIEKIRNIIDDKGYMDYHGNKGKKILLKNHNYDLIISEYYNLFC